MEDSEKQNSASSAQKNENKGTNKESTKVPIRPIAQNYCVPPLFMRDSRQLVTSYSSYFRTPRAPAEVSRPTFSHSRNFNNYISNTYEAVYWKKKQVPRHYSRPCYRYNHSTTNKWTKKSSNATSGTDNKLRADSLLLRKPVTLLSLLPKTESGTIAGTNLKQQVMSSIEHNRKPTQLVVPPIIPVSSTNGVPSMSNPVKTIVKLNDKLRFRLVSGLRKPKSSSSTVSAATSTNNSDINSHSRTTRGVRTKYKIDKRVGKTVPIISTIAKNTVISGLSLVERRESLAQKCRHRMRSFSIRTYSLRRIRKSSITNTPNKMMNSNPNLEPKSMQAEKRRTNFSFRSSYCVINSKRRKRTTSNTEPESNSTTMETQSNSQQLELSCSSLSLSQGSVVRHATRVVQRSRHLLTANVNSKKSCYFFNRVGSCKRFDIGKCQFLHERKNLTVCTKFLNNGKCDKENCSLSHNLKEGRIPLCRFFNNGICNRKNCNYRHVIDAKNQKQCVKSKLANRTIETEQTKKEPAARYFEISPASQPTEAIINRRYPKSVLDNLKPIGDNKGKETSDSTTKSKCKKKKEKRRQLKSDSESDSSINNSTSNDKSIIMTSKCETKIVNDERRQRMLNRIISSRISSDLQTNNNGKLPDFMGFKKN